MCINVVWKTGRLDFFATRCCHKHNPCGLIFEYYIDTNTHIPITRHIENFPCRQPSGNKIQINDDCSVMIFCAWANVRI